MGSRLERIRKALVVIGAMGFALSPLTNAFATSVPDELKDVGISEHLGGRVSISDLSFRDEAGKTVRLADYFRPGHPVLLNLVYFECPNLCNFLLNGLVTSLKSLKWTPGDQFEIVTVSINPKEKPALARAKKAAYLRSYGRAEAAAGWHFLTGSEAQVRRLAAEVGFRYRYDAQTRQYAHTTAMYALTPQGKISRYLYGIEFAPRDLKLALLEASDGKIGSVVDRILLFCYRYDAKTRKYSLYLTRVMQASAGGTVLCFGAYLTVFWRNETRKRKGA